MPFNYIPGQETSEVPNNVALVAGNYAPGQNPCGSEDCTSFRPREIGDYVLALVVYDGCYFRTTFFNPVGGSEFPHVTVTVECEYSASDSACGSFVLVSPLAHRAGAPRTASLR